MRASEKCTRQSPCLVYMCGSQHSREHSKRELKGVGEGKRIISNEGLYHGMKSDVTCRDHVSVVMDAGSRIVNFICDGTVFA